MLGTGRMKKDDPRQLRLERLESRATPSTIVPWGTTGGDETEQSSNDQIVVGAMLEGPAGQHDVPSADRLLAAIEAQTSDLTACLAIPTTSALPSAPWCLAVDTCMEVWA